MEVVSLRPIIFSETATEYDNNGIGVLHDALRCDVNEEHNGLFDLELEYPVDGEWASYIRDDIQVLAKPNDLDEPHAFRIYETDSDLEAGVIFARAASITDDLRGNLISQVSVKDATPQTALNAIKSGLLEPTIFNFVSDIEVRSEAEWTRINPLLAILGDEESVVNIWGGDIKRTNDTVYLYSRRGRDRATTIRPGKNIDGFNMVVSNKGMITKILPFFTYNPEVLPEYEMVSQYDGSTKKQEKETTTQVERPDPVTVTGTVVVSPNAEQYAVNYYEPVDYSSDDYLKEIIDNHIRTKTDAIKESPTIVDTTNFKAEIEQFIQTELNKEAAKYFTEKNPGVDSPNVEIKADMIQLSDSDDWAKYKHLEHIQLSDTVDVYVKKFNVDVEVKIQAISYDSIAERVLTITAGTARTSLSKSITKTYEDRTKALEDYIDTLENGVYNTISKTADGKNKRFSGYTEPSADISSEGDLWFREIGQGEVETYIYNGGSWIPLLSKAQIEAMQKGITDAESLADSADKKAQSIIDSRKKLATDNGFTTYEDLIISKMGAGDFATYFLQESQNIGLVYEVNGENKAIIMIQEGMPYIKGEHIILDGNTIVDGTFTVTETMLANEAVINSLKATGIDARNVRIVNLDASSITGGDLEVTKNFRITHNGVPVFEVDATTGQVKITNYATIKDLEEIELTPGEDAWHVEILSSNGNIFKSGNIQTVLEARVYKGGTDVTDDISLTRFKWKRVSEDVAGDDIWNQRYFGGTKTIVVTPEDVYRRATFFCEIIEEQ
jgi:phage minor structural protein